VHNITRGQTARRLRSIKRALWASLIAVGVKKATGNHSYIRCWTVSSLSTTRVWFRRTRMSLCLTSPATYIALSFSRTLLGLCFFPAQTRCHLPVAETPFAGRTALGQANGSRHSNCASAHKHSNMQRAIQPLALLADRTVVTSRLPRAYFPARYSWQAGCGAKANLGCHRHRLFFARQRKNERGVNLSALWNKRALLLALQHAPLQTPLQHACHHRTAVRRAAQR